jgi:predicted GIY-YIG superfamily endonuclease
MAKEGSTICIYGLKDPRDGQIYYVGKSNDPKTRYKAHLRQEDNNTDKQQWLAELRDAGLQPKQIVLEWVTEDQWQKAEKRWINEGLRLGWPLVNIACTGKGPSAKSGRFHWQRLMARFFSEGEQKLFSELTDVLQLDVCQRCALALIDTKKFLAGRSAAIQALSEAMKRLDYEKANA